MKIELIDRQTVKILLSVHDMQDLAITYDQMDYKDPGTKRAIVALLHKVRQETQVDLSGGKLFIEAFPHCEGGCILYISVLESQVKAPAQKPKRYRGSFNTPLIFRFQDVEELITVCDKLFRQYSHLVLKSSIYLLDQAYILMIYSYFKLDGKIAALVGEYGEVLGKGTVKCSFIKEHAKPLIENTAIETMVEHLCR